MDNPETMATLGTQDTGQRQTKHTTQRPWQHWAHKRQDKDKQNTKMQHNTEN